MSRRNKNGDWELPTNPDGSLKSWEYVPASILMDIRDELQTLNRLLGCSNFLEFPGTLRRIAMNIEKPRRKRSGAIKPPEKRGRKPKAEAQGSLIGGT